jgi:hypothetical protein
MSAGVPTPIDPAPTGTAPTGTDRFAAIVTQRIGGPLGRHAGPGHPWLNATRIALLTATVAWIVAIIQKIPCRTLVAGEYPNTYRRLCYSDIPLLYTGRGLADGNIPYLDQGNYQVLEYPVLTGWLLEFQRRITVLLGAPVGPGLTEQQSIDASRLFGDVNLVVLGCFFLLAVWAHTQLIPSPGSDPSTSSDPSTTSVSERRWDAMMLAASPCVVLTGFINWDLLPVALTALGFLFWGRRRSALAGMMFGLGMAAKLYPLLLLGPLLLLCLRAGRMREFGKLMIGFVIAWLVPNLPVMISAPQGWLAFWTFNSDRGGDLGSIWYVLSLAGHPVEHLNLVNTAVLLLLCAGIGALIMLARHRPRFGQVAYLVIAAFLITNKVYSPQYVLWLLPLMILARPRWREWWIFTFGEVCYFLAIWGHLDQTLVPADGGPDRIYWLAVIVRIACQVWVGAVVIRDILDPDHDPLRTPRSAPPHPELVEGPRPEPTSPRPELVEGPQAAPRRAQSSVVYGEVAVDPIGGVLQDAPDVGWLRRLRAGLGLR